MWSPIKYLFGDFNEETENIQPTKPSTSSTTTPIDRSFWGEEPNERNRIKIVAFLHYVTNWLEKHKGIFCEFHSALIP